MPRVSLTVRINEDVREQVERLAADEHRTLSNVVELAVTELVRTRKPAPSRTEDTINMA